MNDNDFKKALHLYNKKDYRGALKLFLKGDTSSHYYNAGTCCISLGDYPGAIKNFKKSLEICSRKGNSLFNLGYCYYQMKDYKKALMYFNTAWAMDGDEQAKIAINKILDKRKKV